jgi:GNAT superfamily N-acetyltransferase
VNAADAADAAGNADAAAGNADAAGDVVVREAVEEDIPRIVELLTHGSLVEGKEDPGDLAPYRSALAEIDRGPGGVLVAEVEGELVGVCQLIVFRHLQNRGGLCAEVESVHVHPDHRGHGIGGVVMRAAVQRARELGCYRVQLTSNMARPEAHRFYERLGFEPSHRGFKLNL